MRRNIVLDFRIKGNRGLSEFFLLIGFQFDLLIGLVKGTQKVSDWFSARRSLVGCTPETDR